MATGVPRRPRRGPAAAERATAAVAGQPLVAETPDKDDPTRTVWPHGQNMRFPVFGRGTTADGYPWFHLGWFGPVLYAGGKEVEARRYEDELGKLRELSRRLKTVELLFVIDDTGSMHAHRRDVVPGVLARCLGELDEVRRKDRDRAGGGLFADLRVRATVVLFRKNAGGSATVIHSPLSDGTAGAANLAEVVSAEVGDQGAADRARARAKWVGEAEVLPAGANPLEPVFEAVGRGVGLARFTPAATKYAFLMADMGDRSAHARVGGSSGGWPTPWPGWAPGPAGRRCGTASRRTCLDRVVGDDGRVNRTPQELKEAVEDTLVALTKADRAANGGDLRADGLTPGRAG